MHWTPTEIHLRPPTFIGDPKLGFENKKWGLKNSPMKILTSPMDFIWYGIPNKNIGVSEEKYGVFNENLKVSNESWGVESLMKILGISNVNLEGLQ